MKIENAVRAKNGEEFDVLMAIPGVYVVPVPIVVEKIEFSCTLEIDGRKHDIYSKPASMMTRSLHRKIEEAVRAKAGEEFDVLELTTTCEIHVVPAPSKIENIALSCTLEIDGKQHDIYSKPKSTMTPSLHQKIEEAVRAKAGEEFDILELTTTCEIYVVPRPARLSRRCILSGTLTIDGRKYEIYLG